MVIDLPEYNPIEMKAPYAFVVKISDFGKYATRPRIHVVYIKGALQPVVDLSADSLATIYYTTDGSEPTSSSLVYKKHFTISKTRWVKAVALQEGPLPSDINSEHIIKHEWMPAQNPGNIQPGIAYKYYEPEEDINMTSSFKSNIITSGITNNISLDKKQRKEKFSFDFTGYIKILNDGRYTFYTASDDGSKLFIDQWKL